MLLVLIVGIVVGALGGFRARGCIRVQPRLGLLADRAAVAAETSRAARRRQLGDAGTYEVLNCGRILHVDYDCGKLIVERELRR